MTLNDVEQAIRNLITSQPMISSGPSGEVVSSILSIINSYKNFRFLIQNHPSQDSFKFNALNITTRAESELAGVIVQTLQERGINPMVYMPVNSFTTGAQNFMFQSPAGVMGQTMAQPMPQPMAQGMAQQPMPQSVPGNMGSGILGGPVVFNNQPMQAAAPAYPQSNGVQFNTPMMQQPYPPQYRGGVRQPMMNQNPMMRGQGLYPKTAAPTQPISFGDMTDIDLTKRPSVGQNPPRPKNDYKIPKPVARPTKAGVGSSKTSKNSVQFNDEVGGGRPEPVKKIVEQKVIEPEPAVSDEVSESQDEPVPASKASGRNYLLELLKK